MSGFFGLRHDLGVFFLMYFIQKDIYQGGKN